MLENLNKIGFTNRGVKDGSRLAVIKGTKAKGMLIEICFIDSDLDVKLYKSNIDKIVLAIAKGITGKSIIKSSGEIDSVSKPSVNVESEGIKGLNDSLKTSACKKSSIAGQMIEEIKLLQGIVGLNKDGIGTAKLCKLLPELKGNESRGCVTIMQRILILKGMLSKGSATGVIGEANKNGIKRFKT